MNVKRVIAKEGLIIILTGVIWYFAFSLFADKLPLPYPRYRLEFAGGQAYEIDIYPELYFSTDRRSFTRDLCDPRDKVVKKRIQEFISRQGIKPALKEARCINPGQLRFYRLLNSFLALSFLIKIALIYLALLVVRFAFWALKVLRRVR